MPDDARPAGPGQVPSSGWVPIPDPTVLTTEAVNRATEVFRRELQALRETIETRLGGSDRERELLWAELRAWGPQFDAKLADRRREIAGDLESARALIEQRLDSMDKAIELAAKELEKFAGLIRQEWKSQAVSEREYILALIENTRNVSAERLAKIDGQFDANEKAVSAAFAAAKEAVAEQNRSNSAAIRVSEENTKEQLTALNQVSGANFRAMEDKITDARDRLTAIENLTRGIEKAGGEAREQRTEQRLSQSALVSIVVAAIIAVGVVVSIITLVHH